MKYPEKEPSALRASINGPTTDTRQQDQHSSASRLMFDGVDGVGRATSLWGCAAAEIVLGPFIGRERAGALYQALAPVVGVCVAATYTVLVVKVLAGMSGGANMIAMAMVLSLITGTLFGVLFLLSHSRPATRFVRRYLHLNLLPATSYTISLFKTVVLALLYGAAVSAFCNAMILEGRAVDAGGTNFFTLALWLGGFAFFTHAVFDWGGMAYERWGRSFVLQTANRTPSGRTNTALAALFARLLAWSDAASLLRHQGIFWGLVNRFEERIAGGRWAKPAQHLSMFTARWKARLESIKPWIWAALVAGTIVVIASPAFLGLYAGVFLLKAMFLVWAIVIAVVVARLYATSAAEPILNLFARQVARVKEQAHGQPDVIDQALVAELSKLNESLKALFIEQKIRVARLKRAVVQINFQADKPDPLGKPRLPLRALGHVLSVAERFSPDAPIVALYKLNGEQMNPDGTVRDTYLILKTEASPDQHAEFMAKIHSPIKNYSVAATDGALAAMAELPSQSAIRAPASSDQNVEYVLSLLGPVTPMRLDELDRRLRTIVDHRASFASSGRLPPLDVSRVLRALLTGQMDPREHSSLAAQQALQQEPQLFIDALAGIDHERAHKAGVPACFATLAELLAPSSPRWQSALVRLMIGHTALISACEVVPEDAKIRVRGVTYVDARGAEGDAGFLRRVAQLLDAAVPLLAANAKKFFVTTNLTAMLQALAEKSFVLNTVSGSEPVNVQSLVGGAENIVVFAANPALVDLAGVSSVAGFIYWTLSGLAREVLARDVDVFVKNEQDLRAGRNQG
jgi:hypothetical protein